jgi:hypothetical protein
MSTQVEVILLKVVADVVLLIMEMLERLREFSARKCTYYSYGGYF